VILGVGIDVVDVMQFKALMNDRFVASTFTRDELAYSNAATGDAIDHLAARFAAKEAALKALDSASGLLGLTPPSVQLTDIEVRRDARGRPTLAFTGAAKHIADALEIHRVHVSLTHDGNVSGAVVVLERNEFTRHAV
jgi:holo-[acyl-carrier protein] synthase